MVRTSWLTTLVLAAMVGGCTLPDRNPGASPPPARTYSGLANQTCAVMVWTDVATRNEYSSRIQVDIARALQSRLEARAAGEPGKKPELPGAKFISPLAVVKFQQENPALAASPITEVAPRLGVSRLIYIEVERFELRSPRTVMLLKGTAVATLRVVEVNQGVGRVAFEEQGISVSFPPDAPEGVVASDTVNELSIYRGTVDALGERLSVRFKEVR